MIIIVFSIHLRLSKKSPQNSAYLVTEILVTFLSKSVRGWVRLINDYILSIGNITGHIFLLSVRSVTLKHSLSSSVCIPTVPLAGFHTNDVVQVSHICLLWLGNSSPETDLSHSEQRSQHLPLLWCPGAPPKPHLPLVFVFRNQTQGQSRPNFSPKFSW